MDKLHRSFRVRQETIDLIDELQDKFIDSDGVKLSQGDIIHKGLLELKELDKILGNKNAGRRET